MKKYLVTGGTGFIGSALVKRLIRDGNAVRILDNNLRGKESRLKDLSGEIEIIEADIRDLSMIEKACKGVDIVCHLAYINGTEYFYTKPELVLDVAVKGIMNIIDGCIKEGVKEFMLASSSEVYQTARVIPTPEDVPLAVPDPLNPRYSYGAGKIISELMAINYGRKCFERVVIFRPHNVYGPDMGFEHVVPQFILRMQELCANTRAREINFPIQGTGEQTRSFIFIDDFIDGLMLLIEKGMHLGIYNIGTMEEMAIKDVAGEIGAYFNKKIMVGSGVSPDGSPLRRCPDIAKLQKLGFRPKVSFKSGIKSTIEWYLRNTKTAPKKITENKI